MYGAEFLLESYFKPVDDVNVEYSWNLKMKIKVNLLNNF